MKQTFKSVQIFTVVFVVLAFAKAVQAQDIERVEPPNWWVDMEHSAVEFMMYQKDIASYETIVSDLPVLKVRKTENPNYVFVTLDTQNQEPGNYEITLTKGPLDVLNKTIALKKRSTNSKYRKGFDSSDVIYLLMPDRFANGDPSNDSVDGLSEKADRDFKGGRHGGDIQGIIDNIDYIHDLGATAVWSTPLLQDNDNRYSYHTYAQSDVYKIDPRYGSNEDYKRLADELHKKDMKLIMDYVTNHWGATHWMMRDLPSKTWIHQFDDNADKNYPVPGYANSSYRQTTQMDPNASDRDMRYAEKGWFVSTMPDLNQSDPLVLNYLIQNSIWWIEYAGLDGFRVDTYSYNEKEGIAKWTKAIMNEYPYFNIVGETWMHDQAQIAYWQKDSPVGAIQNFNSGCPSVMDFTLHDAIMTVFNEDEQGWDKGMIKAYENFVNDFLYSDINNILVFAGNHDTNRINGNALLNENLEKYKLALTLIMTVRGIPQIYYGDEIGMGGNRDTDGDGDIRRDFPGGWDGDENNAFDQPNQLQKGYQDFTRKLLNYRKSKPVIHTGEFTQFVPENNCYVYFRHNDDEKIMVVINNNPQKMTLDLSRFREMLHSSSSGKEIISDRSIEIDETLNVRGKSAMIIEFN